MGIAETIPGIGTDNSIASDSNVVPIAGASSRIAVDHGQHDCDTLALETGALDPETRASAADLESLLDTLPVLIALFDTDQKFLFSNRAHQRWWGRTEEEMLGCHLCEIIGEANYRDSLPYVLQALEGHMAMYEAHHNYAGTGRRYVSVCYAPVLGPDSLVRGVSVHVQDLTAKRAALDAQQELSARYQRLYVDAPVMLHSIDRSGRLLSVSSYWLETLGYAREEVLGRPITDFLTPESERYAREVAFPEFFMNGFVRDVPYQMRTRDGRVLDVLLSAVQEKRPDGEMLRSLSVVIDVTKQRSVERRNYDLEEQLRHAQKMEALGTLAGGIAHDFNNILAGILGYLELALLDLDETAPVRNYLTFAQGSAGRAKDLVKRILTFSKGRSHERHALSLIAVLDEVFALVRATFPSTIEIVSRVSDSDLFVEGDPTELHQVFLNILTNAEHAMREHGGTLRVEAHPLRISEGSPLLQRGLRPGAWIKVSISDSGSGMTEQVRSRIFEPYFTTKSVGEGTGLGLSVSHGIVSAHGGAILVRSMQELGSTFEVYLPATRVPERAIITEIAPAPVSGSGRILLVDDEQVIASLGTEMLQTLGYQVTACTNSEAAAALLRAAPQDFDLVITDQTMPGITGAKLAKLVGTLRPDLPVILCTGYMTGSEIEIGGPVRAVLSKPYSLAELSHLVKQLIQVEGIARGVR